MAAPLSVRQQRLRQQRDSSALQILYCTPSDSTLTSEAAPFKKFSASKIQSKKKGEKLICRASNGSLQYCILYSTVWPMYQIRFLVCTVQPLFFFFFFFSKSQCRWVELPACRCPPPEAEAEAEAVKLPAQKKKRKEKVPKCHFGLAELSLACCLLPPRSSRPFLIPARIGLGYLGASDTRRFALTHLRPRTTILAPRSILQPPHTLELASLESICSACVHGLLSSLSLAPVYTHTHAPFLVWHRLDSPLTASKPSLPRTPISSDAPRTRSDIRAANTATSLSSDTGPIAPTSSESAPLKLFRICTARQPFARPYHR